MAEKFGGAESICKCGTKMICREVESTWQGKTNVKLQWQNVEDGKPHYKVVGPSKFECNIPGNSSERPMDTPKPADIIGSFIPTNKIPSDWTPKILTLEEVQLWYGILDRVIEYDMLAQRRLVEHEFFDSSNGAHNGQLKKFAMAFLKEVHSRQAEEK